MYGATAAALVTNKNINETMMLWQGFWPDGIYTAPTDEALQHDIKFAKSLGYNLLRKHIKASLPSTTICMSIKAACSNDRHSQHGIEIFLVASTLQVEPDRWYYHCDR